MVCILLLAVHPCHGCCVEGEAGHEAGCGGQNLGCTLRAGMGMRRILPRSAVRWTRQVCSPPEPVSAKPP